MQIKERANLYNIGLAPVKFQGNTRLDLLRNGKIIKRIEKHNTVTAWLENAKGPGNFRDLINPSNITNLAGWFNGCLLTDQTNDAALSMISSGSKITAQAGDDAYTGTYTKRGSFNSSESGAITGGRKFVWDWLTNQGNGPIASVCLTRGALGKCELGQTAVPDSSYPINEILNSSATAAGLPVVSIIDYENETAYAISYANGTITVTEYELATKLLHIKADETGLINTTTHQIAQTVNNYSEITASVSYTGDTIHLLTFQANSGTLNDYAIVTTDWTCTATTHTYSGVSFWALGGYGTTPIMKDAMPIINGYVYAYSGSGQKIVKCSLTNDADVEDFDNPLYTLGALYTYNNYANGPSVIMPNGDFYKIAQYQNVANQYALYYHGGDFYAVILNRGHNLPTDSVNANPYGTIIRPAIYGSNNIVLVEAFHPYVSTVNNLETAVTKTADLTMKLTYEITESTT